VQQQFYFINEHKKSTPAIDLISLGCEQNCYPDSLTDETVLKPLKQQIYRTAIQKSNTTKVSTQSLNIKTHASVFTNAENTQPVKKNHTQNIIQHKYERKN